MKEIMTGGLLMTLIITGCTQDKTVKVEKIDIPDSLIVSDNSNFDIEKMPENCYLQVVGKDSAFVQITDNLGTYSGPMRINNHEKDSSTGELTGFKVGDTLKLIYAFESEGVKSERPIFFLEKGSKLIEGLGDYTNIKTLKFEDNNAFNTVDCKNFDKNFEK